MADRHIVTGRIIAVQEERLRINSDSGQSLLFTLSRFAHLPSSLEDLVQAQAPVRVIYEGEPDLASGVVKRIDLI